MEAPGREPSALDLDLGFLALPRRLCASPFFQALRPDERWVVVQMLLIARYAEGGEFWFAGHRIPLAPGQFIETEQQLADAAGSTRKTVRTVMRKATSAGLISRARVTRAGQCPSVTTILDYDRIRLLSAEAGHRTGLPAGRSGATKGPADGPLTGHEGAPSEQGNPVEPGEPRNLEIPVPLSPSAPTSPASASGQVDEVLRLWNGTAKRAGLPRCRGSDKVRGMIRTRLRATGWFDSFRSALTFIEGSKFHTGENDQQWSASLNWVLKSGKAEELADRRDARKERTAAEWEGFKSGDVMLLGLMGYGTPPRTSEDRAMYRALLDSERELRENPPELPKERIIGPRPTPAPEADREQLSPPSPPLPLGGFTSPDPIFAELKDLTSACRRPAGGSR